MGSDLSKVHAENEISSIARALNPLTAVYPPPPNGYGWIKDDAGKYGSVIINNHCEYPVYVWSTGARQLGGPQNNYSERAFWTPHDNIMYEVLPGQSYGEPFRSTCQQMNATHEYCPDEDKGASQGVTLKISRTRRVDTDITQLEYFLVQNLKEGDTSKRLHYDISLLDCGDIEGVIDTDGTYEQHQEKVARCPGYDGGLALAFTNDSMVRKCQPIYCDGKTKCPWIFTWDPWWARMNDARMVCAEEFYGNMHLALCVNRYPAQAHFVDAQFCRWAATATNALSLSTSCTATLEPQTGGVRLKSTSSISQPLLKTSVLPPVKTQITITLPGPTVLVTSTAPTVLFTYNTERLV